MRQEVDVVFLCGGSGIRMGELARSTQKCMLPFEGKPLLQHSLEEATKALGRFNPILAVSYRAKDVVDYFGRFWGHDEIMYVYDEGGVEDRGVVQGVKEYLQGGPFLVVHGNILFNGALFVEAIQMQEAYTPLATISLAKKVNESKHAVVRLENRKVTDMVFPAPDVIPDGYLRDMGLNAYDSSVYGLIERFAHDPRIYMMGLLERALGEDDEVAGIQYYGDWLHFERPIDFRREREQK